MPVVVEPGELPRYQPHFAHRQLTLQPRSLGIEEDQRNGNIACHAVHAVGRFGAARDEVLQDKQRQGDQLVFVQAARLRQPRSLLHPAGLGADEIPHVRTGNTLDQRG